MDSHIPRIALTPGEPAGIGPDLCVRIAQQPLEAVLVAVADPELLATRAAALGLPLALDPFTPGESRAAHEPGHLQVLTVPLAQPVVPGQTESGNVSYVLECLRQASAACQDGSCSALVTGPVHKGIINRAGIPFTGHTEFLAQLTHTACPVMMLTVPGLRVALATTHLPLAGVSRAITRERITGVLNVLHHDLREYFGIPQPHILVCGLNPHAGEEGYLGREEIDIIEPVLEELRAHDMRLTGPLSADTLFIPERLRTADAVLAMYHDQGLPVLKHLGFGEAVNITLGLPFIRTSVDHGTALELAGTDQADSGSLLAAVALAVELAGNRRR